MQEKLFLGKLRSFLQGGLGCNKIQGEKDMRLDKFLKVSRVIKRRSVANDACDAGRISINGKVAKAGTAVKLNDIVEVSFGNSNTKFEILAIQESTRKEDCANMYRIIEE